MTNKGISSKIYGFLKVGALYEIPFCSNLRGGKIADRTVLFQYQGKTGEGSMLHFLAVPGGWSLTLSAIQLLDPKDGLRIYMPGQAPQKAPQGRKRKE